MPRPFAALTYRGQLGRLTRLAEAAVRLWPIRSPRLRRLHYGENATFQVRDPDGGQWVLRVARPGYQSLAAIRSELWWVTQLRAAGLDVPAPERGRDGAFVQTVGVPGVPEARNCVLLRWMTGRFLYRGLRPAHLERLGHTVARIHAVSATLDPPADFCRQAWDARGMLGPGANWGDPGDCAFLDDRDKAWAGREAARIRGLLEAYGTGPDRFGFIHADLHYGNIIFHQGRPRLIDFDDCGPGFLAHDLRTVIYGNEKPFAREAICAGYAQVRPLPPDLDHALALLNQAQRLRAIAWLGTRSDNPRLHRVAVARIPKILQAARECAGEVG